MVAPTFVCRMRRAENCPCNFIDVKFVLETGQVNRSFGKSAALLPVTQPLLALGKFMHAGWCPTQDDTGMYLKHAGSGLEVPMGYKGNSLVVQASLSKIAESAHVPSSIAVVEKLLNAVFG